MNYYFVRKHFVFGHTSNNYHRTSSFKYIYLFEVKSSRKKSPVVPEKMSVSLNTPLF